MSEDASRTRTCAYRKSDMTPCVIVDGDICYSDPPNPVCVGCNRSAEEIGVPTHDTPPCGHDPKWRVGSPDDPGSTQACELCDEIGKEREKLFSFAIKLKPDKRRTNHDFDVGFEEACRLFTRAIRRGEY